MLILLILTTPLIYWSLGAALLTWRTDNALALSLLLGGAVAGLACELAYVLGASPSYVLTPVFVLSVGTLLARRSDRRLAPSLLLCLALYGVALVPATASPFPILGTWDGDWLLLMNAGQQLFDGTRMTAESLQRPPLFGAATAPLWMMAPGLPPFQLFATAMSAGALGACVYAANRFWPRTVLWRLLVPLVLSPFFLHHTAACWGKLMAAGLLIAACVDASGAGERRGAWWSAVWFALAVAVHLSSILYAPLVGAFVVAAHSGKIGPSLRAVVPFALCGILFVGLFQGWTLSEYGLDAQVNANPAVAQRDPDVSFVANTSLVILTSFVAWGPFEGVIRWFGQSDALSAGRAAKEGFWFLTSWIQMLSATFVGAYLPLLLTGWRSFWSSLSRWSMSRAGLGFTAAVAIVILGNGLLNPYYSLQGSMQTGLVPLGLGGFLLLGRRLADGPANRWRISIALTVFLGTLPWLALNLGVTFGLGTSESFRATMAAGSESDWDRITAYHLSSLGLAGFPGLQLIVAAAILISVGVAWTSFRRAAAATAA